MSKRVKALIDRFQLEPHPEGGYFKETYRSEESIKKMALPDRFSGDRSYSTGIYFLLAGTNVSKFHKIQSDEMWHFYEGDSLTIHEITPDGIYNKHLLGADIEQGEQFQLVIRAGSWFGASVNDPNTYALVGCTVAPGFDFSDFVLAKRNELLADYPEYKEIIEKLT